MFLWFDFGPLGGSQVSGPAANALKPPLRMLNGFDFIQLNDSELISRGHDCVNGRESRIQSLCDGTETKMTSDD